MQFAEFNCAHFVVGYIAGWSTALQTARQRIGKNLIVIDNKITFYVGCGARVH